MATGWIKLHRQIQECEFLWDSKEEPFDRRSAWIDLLLMANHKDKRLMFRGKAITVKCGQRITSMHQLAVRWHWGINRVRHFLDLLQGEEMIIRESDNIKTLLTIVNYQKYQCIPDFADTPTDTPTDTVTDTPTDTPTNTAQIQSQIPNNNEKNDNNEKNEKNEKNIYQLIADMYNATCVSFPKVVTISDARKKAIKARLNKYTLDDFQQLFTLAEASDFLKGGNDRNWTANFDWMIADSHMAKILEGQYKNRPKKNSLDDTYEMMRKWAEEGS